ncbi:hypothetical protein GCM10010412_061490 [Nonomuraea recticatena]|uniref:Tn3 transposase DDE domain-containing protein n=1 Tax=Nonomuraea recticatena TaxID=46178 RepID=A0ABP6EYQ6_9ACTN
MGAARAAAQQDQGRYGGAEHPGGDGRRRPRAIPKGGGSGAVLRDPQWAGKLTEEDRRALSPLFWAHVNPYGRFGWTWRLGSTSLRRERTSGGMTSARCEPHLWSRRKAEMPVRVG